MDKKYQVDLKEELVEKLKKEYGFDLEDKFDNLLFEFEKFSYFDQYSMKAMLLCFELQMLKEDNGDSINIPISVELIDKAIDVLNFVDNLELKKEEEA